MEAIAYNPDKALIIIDSAYIVGNIPQYRADILKMKVYSQTQEKLQLDSTFEIGERLLRHDSVSQNPARRLIVLDLLVNASNLSADAEKLLDYTERRASLCRELGNETEALRTEAYRGNALAHLGHIEEGLDMIDNVINSLDGIRKFNEMDTWIIAARRKINILDDLPGTNEQITALALRILNRLDDYSRNPRIYKDSSDREPEEDERPSYIEFYQSKCYAYLANAHAEKDPAEAKRYMAMYENTASGRSFMGRVMIAPILCKLGEYDKMEEIYSQMDANHYFKDSLNKEYLTMLHNRAEAAEAQGRTTDALTFWKRYDVLRGVSAERAGNGSQYLYASRYEADKLQEALKKEQAQKAKFIRLTWFLGIIILLFAIYLLLTQVFKRNKPAAEETSRQESTPIMPRVRAKTPSEMDDAELFTYIDSIIRRDKLYLDPLLSREILMSRIKGLSTHRIGTAFSKGSAFKSFPGYILNLRMEYAAELLRSHPDLNIKDVGEASGFANNSTFCTNFKACYGMTPSAYRKAQSEK